MEAGTGDKIMRLRYAGTCRVCSADLAEKTQAVYERATKTVRCLSHEVAAEAGPAPEAEPVTPEAEPVTREAEPVPEAEPVALQAVEAGTAGASARREFERRKAKREERIRTKHPRLGGLILAVSEERRTTTVWDVGAVGEERLGKGLDRQASDGVRLLHDRRIPRSRANIDHVAVTTNGIYVIDAKKYRGRPNLRVEGGILRPRVERLLVGSRDCTKLVDGVLKQVEVVRAVLDVEVPIRGVLCFVEADWPLIGGSFTIRGVDVLWPKKLYPQLQAPGPLAPSTVDDLHRRLAAALLPA